MKLKELFAPHNMTEGAPWKRLLEFSVPMLIGNFAQQMYNTVDSIVVGEYIGDLALSAVGSAAPILNLLLALFVGVATGAGIVVSQYFGAGAREKLSRAVGNCITLGFIATIATMVIGVGITRPLLTLLDTPASIYEWCADYLILYFLGAIGFTFYNILSGILRGLGDSVSALVFLLVSAALNIVLDIWFVAGLNMGVPGVALATVIAQGISAVLCLIKLMRMTNVFDLKWGMLRLQKDIASRIVKLGLPSGITQAIISVAMLTVQALTNSMGEMVIAAAVVIMRVDGFAMLPNLSFGQAMTVYTGQNVGARKLDRVHMGTRHGMIMNVAFSAAITVIILLFGPFLFDLFTDTPELIDLATRMMRILAVGYICMAITQTLGGVMRGAGDTMTPMWISLITTIAIRVPLAYILADLTVCTEWPNGRPEALWGSLLICWALGAIISIIIYRRGKWKRKAEMAMQ